MTSEDRALIAEIDAARATERNLFQRLRADLAESKGNVASAKSTLAKARDALAASERNLADFEQILADLSGLADASLTRLAGYDAARREVASR